MLQILCALVSAPWAFPVCDRASVFFFWLPGPALCTVRVVCTGEVFMPCLSQHPRPTLCTTGFCVLLFIPPDCHLVGATVCELFMDWEVQLSLLSALLSPCFAWLSEIMHFPLGPLCEGASQCIGTLPASQLPLSLSAQVPVQKFSIFSLFMSPSSLLPHSRELSLPHWKPGVFCCHLQIALKELFHVLMSFWCVCGEAGDLPILLLHYLLLPPSSWVCFCRSFFLFLFCSLLLCFLPGEVPLALVVKLMWWCWILLAFAVCKPFDFSVESEWELSG